MFSALKLSLYHIYYHSPSLNISKSAAGTLLSMSGLYTNSSKYKKKNPNTSSERNTTNRVPPSVSFPENRVGLKAWSCLTCIIQRSAHHRLLWEAARLKIYSDLNKGLKPHGRENRKGWVAQVDFCEKQSMVPRQLPYRFWERKFYFSIWAVKVTVSSVES